MWEYGTSNAGAIVERDPHSATVGRDFNFDSAEEDEPEPEPIESPRGNIASSNADDPHQHPDWLFLKEFSHSLVQGNVWMKPLKKGGTTAVQKPLAASWRMNKLLNEHYQDFVYNKSLQQQKLPQQSRLGQLINTLEKKLEKKNENNALSQAEYDTLAVLRSIKASVSNKKGMNSAEKREWFAQILPYIIWLVDTNWDVAGLDFALYSHTLLDFEEDATSADKYNSLIGYHGLADSLVYPAGFVHKNGITKKEAALKIWNYGFSNRMTNLWNSLEHYKSDDFQTTLRELDKERGLKLGTHSKSLISDRNYLQCTYKDLDDATKDMELVLPEQGCKVFQLAFFQ